MPRDIDTIIERIRAVHPDAKIEQLKVSHPGVDDDGIWYFGIPGEKEEVKLESSTGAAPFDVDYFDKRSPDEIRGASVEQAVREVSAFIEALKRKSKEANRVAGSS